MIPPRSAYCPADRNLRDVIVARLFELAEQPVAIELCAALEREFETAEDIRRGHGFVETLLGEDDELAALRGAQGVKDREPLGGVFRIGDRAFDRRDVGIDRKSVV